MAASSEKCRFTWLFFFISFLHLLAILLFTRGFLLTRTELSSSSNCSDVSQSPCTVPHPPENVTGSDRRVSSTCWTQPAVDRLLIIVLDALRIDFLAPSTFYEEEKPWMNKLEVLQKLAFEERISARIFKAIADPPTTSLQRLKGLTTGGLPTFIDVGNSFGAPAITEDNLIYQLVKNGKRVVMMGDDTWLQLFPEHFERAFPFPSFNVKDLHTVDDGCVDHLFPSLRRDDWDVLIAHFLGVDHAGHIFGVDSTPMIEKLKQYNVILEQVVEILKNQSGPGGLHENTLLLVMGDHGQTLNGDHGGGTPEEVETALFAMNLKSPPTTASSIFDSSSCRLNVEGKELCVSTIQQLDFSATIAALLGVPFPFGSIGTVNHELFTLVAGTWSQQNADAAKCVDMELWMQNYINVLCINSWQVKRYIDLYSLSSIIGFSKEDMLHVGELYAQAQANYSDSIKNKHLFQKEVPIDDCMISLSVMKKQISAYKNFLHGVAELARSKWTEFDTRMMAMGLSILLACLLIQFFWVRRVNKLILFGNRGSSVRFILPLLLVTIRACSFLSNSYILAEAKVANFLLATTGILNLRHSVMKGSIQVEAVVFLLLSIFLGWGTEHGLSKQSLGSHFMNNTIWMLFYEVASILALVLLAILLYKNIAGKSWWPFMKYFLLSGTFLSYILIAVYWTFESKILAISVGVEGNVKNFIPRVIYAIGFAQLALLLFCRIFKQKDMTSDYCESVMIRAIAMISIWSPTVMVVLGRQGPFVALVLIMAVWCITSLQKVAHDTKGDTVVGSFVSEPISVTQMSLLAVCLFFYTGHWCTFDGLRYGAAFVGFDDFNIVRQGILLSIDTFGLSHILPIFCLPFLVALKHPLGNQRKEIFFADLTKVFLMYGLITAVTTTFTIICVTIHRRHLMVWGLFAPKYVFDVVSLILTDVLICMASLFYS
ncbi:hypothetical protein H6P81_004517 [Aristolochia fimbriata]|uniref:GPI ethanolamine phosphate transferase 3 n=1 Tax=Aristolochia fimbriata TaxID=158543 RepID=A0AAV7FH28_ARIFI|nr:hypothetical protein H6P81_004517 [Aristolochia fimbriata]